MKETIGYFKTRSNNPNDLKALIESYLIYKEFKKRKPDCILYEFGLPQNKQLIDVFGKIPSSPEWEQAIREKARECLVEAFRNEAFSHTERRERVENAIRLVIKELYEKKNGKIEPTSLVLLAEAYLRRSKIIRPKGNSIPAKKLEAIRKGIQYANEAITKGAGKDGYRIKALLYVELYRLEKEGDEPIEKVLREALNNGCTDFNNSAEDVKIAALYSEKSKDKQYFAAIKNSSLDGIELEKAKIYALEGDNKQLEDNIQKLISSLKSRYFADPLWDDTVRFLERLYKSGNEAWKKIAPAVWDACQELEKTTYSPLHIRWYWSRMRTLYDLAFLAAESNYERKAEIADSLKSRPALRWGALENLANKLISEEERSQLKAIIEAYARSLTGSYLKAIPKTLIKPIEALPLTKIPDGWIVVHFYLNSLEKRGYALIYDKSTWSEKNFSYDELFEVFRAWQTNYYRDPRLSYKLTADLCLAIGKAMPFLFEFPDEKSVLFIPHDFLHRLPLHGAMRRIDGVGIEIFLQKHPSSYLPAWTYYRTRGVTNSFDKPLFLNNSNYSFGKLKERIDVGRAKDPAQPACLTGINKPPKLLIIACHGRADAVNPFNSKLMLQGDGVTNLELLKSEMKLTGSLVILGACETEVVPPVIDPLDEHLSLSAAFLSKGAASVIGALWKADFLFFEDIALGFLNGSDRPEIIVQSWQKKKIEKFIENNDTFYLYMALPYRVLGIG